jgi:predicted nuclease of predicted toxin-antitoxin system
LIRFLVDENLSPALLPVARAAGHEAMHVNHLGLRTARDWTLMRFAIDGNWVLVTNNTIEFRRRYHGTSPHPGVVFLVPSLPRAGQVALFQAALDYLGGVESLANQAIDVDLADNGSIVLRRYPIP